VDSLGADQLRPAPVPGISPKAFLASSLASCSAESGSPVLVRRADGTHVHTVRDVVIEVDASGRVVDEWRLFEILDPNRSIVLKAIDQHSAGGVDFNHNVSHRMYVSAVCTAKIC